MRSVKRMLSTAIMSILLCSGTAIGQDVASQPHADQQRSDAVLPRVTVIQATSGAALNGRLMELGGEAVRILVDGQTRELSLTDVRRIDLDKRDSLKNGAVIGAIVLGGWCALVCGQGLGTGAQLIPAVAANAAVGALIGAGIDAGRRERTTIYPRPALSAHTEQSPRLLIT